MSSVFVFFFVLIRVKIATYKRDKKLAEMEAQKKLAEMEAHENKKHI
jgi:hypothetical protein